MGLFAEHQVQKDFAAGKYFPHLRLEAIADMCIPRIEADGIDTLLLCNEDGPGIVKLLADDGV